MPPTVCQLSTHQARLILWELHGTVKLCRLIERKINIDMLQHETPLSFAFAIDGTLYIITRLGNVHHVYIASGQCNLSLKWEGENKGFQPSLACFAAGILISPPDGVLRHYKKVKGMWAEQWRAEEPQMFQALAYYQAKDTTIGTTTGGALCTIGMTEEAATVSLTKNFEQSVEYFAFLKPLDDFLIVVNQLQELVVCKKRNGERTGALMIGSYTCIQTHPQLPFVIIGNALGELTLINVLDIFEPKFETNYQLSRFSLTKIVFATSGDHMTVLDENRDVYILKCALGFYIEVVQHFPLGRELSCPIFLESNSELTLIALLIDAEVSAMGSSKLLLISFPFDEPLIYSQNEVDLPETLTSLAPVSGSDSEFLGVALRQRQIKVLKLSGTEVTVVSSINTDHVIREINVSSDKYHIVTYAADGRVTVFHSVTHRQMFTMSLHSRYKRGVKQAQVDALSQYLVTLGHAGTLICTKMALGSVNIALEDEITKNFQNWKRRHSGDVTVGFTPDGEFKNYRWLDMQRQKVLEKEEELSRDERYDILATFRILREKLKVMMDTNQSVAEAEKIELDAFNLDQEFTASWAKQAEEERNAEDQRMGQYIESQGKVNEAVVEKCRETMEVHGRQIRGIFTKSKVDSYPLAKKKTGLRPVKHVLMWRKLELTALTGDDFLPWTPIAAE